MFAFIVGFSALLVAGCAAYFSVQGLASLYAGAFLAVCIMAGALEFGKLVAASYLHRYWDETKLTLKLYLIIAIFTLMGITSLGIFGFLTSAYQQSNVKIEMIDAKRFELDSKKQTYEGQIELLKNRLETLNQVRITQEQRVQDAGNYKLPREQAYAAIEKANQEINESQEKIKNIVEEVQIINNDLVMLKSEEAKSTDIGTLKFVAQSFNVDVKTIVKWFTLIIVLVFDPLAVSLVLAYNNIVYKKPKNKKIENLLDNEIEESEKTIFQKILTPMRVKYKDK
jgi:nitrate reductase NapE component